MFRSELVYQVNPLLGRFHLDQPAVVAERSRDELAPRKIRQLPPDLPLHLAQQPRGSRHQPHPLVTGTVLGLRQKVGGDKLRLGRVVGEHEHLAGAGQQVNCHLPEQQPFRRHHVSVAGTKNFLHAPNRRRPVGHCRHCLRPAGPVNLRCASCPRRVQQGGVDRAVLPAGRADDDLRTAGHLRQRHRHQRRGNQRRCSAGNVNPDSTERVKFLTDPGALRVLRPPVFAQGFSAEAPDVLPRRFHRRAQSFVSSQ